MASNQIFAYIDKGYKLTDDLKKQYRNSLIFLGDEGQIYSPVNDTYIGIGHTAYTNTISYIENAYTYVIEQVGAVLDAIISTSVTHNVNRVNGLEKEVTIYSSTYTGSALNSKTLTNANGTVASNYINVSEGDRTVDYVTNYEQVKSTTGEGGTGNFTNGVNVTSYTIWVKGGSEYLPTTGTAWDAAIDGAMKAASATGWEAFNTSNVANGSVVRVDAREYERNAGGFATSGAFMGSYIYVDDTQTVDFVKQAIAYNTTFTKYWSNNVINRVYSEILGSEYIPVSLDQLDNIDEHDTKENVYYIKLLPTTSSNTEAAKTEGGATIANTYTTTTNNTDSAYYPVNVTNGVVSEGTGWDTIKYNTSQRVWNNDTHDTIKITTGTSSLNPAELTVTAGSTLDTRFENNGTNYILYYKNTDRVSSSVDITNGLDTIKEVAYILDMITDGSEDGGISLAYNIASNAIDIQNLKNSVNSLLDGAASVTDIAFNQNDLELKGGTLSTKEGGTTEDALSRKYVKLFGADTYDNESPYQKNVVIGAELTVLSDANVVDTTAKVETVSTYFTTESDVAVPYLNGNGLVDDITLNTYVSRSYDLLIQTIKAAEANVGAYIYQVLDGIDMDSMHYDANSAYQRGYKATADILTIGQGVAAGTTLSDAEAAAGHKVSSLVVGTADGKEYPVGQYIKKVTQVNGYVFAYYDSFQLGERNYAYEQATGDPTLKTTYNYAKLTLEGDVINLSTYTSAIENVTSYGFLADALSVKSYIATCLAWVDITPTDAENAVLNAAYRKFGNTTTSNTTYSEVNGEKGAVYGTSTYASSLHTAEDISSIIATDGGTGSVRQKYKDDTTVKNDGEA